MTLKEAFDKVVYVMRTMENGEIHLLVRKGEIKYVNRLEEVLYKEPPENSGKI